VPVGIDGEEVTLAPPLEFATLPGALAVRIASGHPGASPSTAVPRGLGRAVAKMVRIAIGGDPSPRVGDEPGERKFELTA
jgi:hypothetical protein